jgi:hypothetical protein
VIGLLVSVILARRRARDDGSVRVCGPGGQARSWTCSIRLTWFWSPVERSTNLTRHRFGHRQRTLITKMNSVLRRRETQTIEAGPRPKHRDPTMNSLRKFHPDLHACELEDRVLPVIANLGVIVLTTGGYVLTIPFPGVAASTGGQPGSTAIPTSVYMTGSGAISSIQPGNITGVPNLAATGTAGPSGGAGVTITFGSGTNDATAASIPLVTRNTIANDALNPPPRIGLPSGDRSPVLPAGQFYQGGVPRSAPAPPASETPVGQSSQSPMQRPVDSPPIRLGGAAPRRPSDLSGNSMTALEDWMP